MKAETILIIGGMAAALLFMIRKSNAAQAPKQTGLAGMEQNAPVLSYIIAPDGTTKYTGPYSADPYHPGGMLTL